MNNTNFDEIGSLEISIKIWEDYLVAVKKSDKKIDIINFKINWLYNHGIKYYLILCPLCNYAAKMNKNRNNICLFCPACGFWGDDEEVKCTDIGYLKIEQSKEKCIPEIENIIISMKNALETKRDEKRGN